MNEQEQHEMVLGTIYLTTGAEEWHCPSCGRRILIDWQPKFKKVVLEAGDDFAIHWGSKGDLQVESPHVIID